MDRELGIQMAEEKRRIQEVRNLDIGLISSAVIGYSRVIKELPVIYSSEKVRAAQAEKKRQRLEEERLVRSYLPPAIRNKVMFSHFLVEFDGHMGVRSFPLWYEKNMPWRYVGGSKSYSDFRDNCGHKLNLYLPLKSEAGYIESSVTLHTAGVIAEGVDVEIDNLLSTKSSKEDKYIIYPPSKEKIVVNVKERTDGEFRCYECPPSVFQNKISVIGEETVAFNDSRMPFMNIVVRVMFSSKSWEGVGNVNSYLEGIWGKNGLSRKWGGGIK